MYSFRPNLRRAIERSGYANSTRQLSIDAALGEKTLTNLLNDKSVDTTKTGPGLFGMKRVADLLGVSLDYLAGGSADEALSPVEFMKRYRRSGGMLEGFKGLRVCYIL